MTYHGEINSTGGVLMNKQRIYKLVNDLFYDVVETDEVREQKEELRIHLTERVNDYMAEGYSFEDALYEAKKSLGDPKELVSGFERKRVIEFDDLDEDYGINVRFRVNRLFTKLTPLAPFIYVILGITQNSWMPWLPVETWNWWTWGWVIIPIFGILSSGIGTHTITALSPFIYILLGVFFGWWLWGWMIIPISGILFSSGCKKKKRKKKKKWKPDFVIDIEESVTDSMQGIGETISESVGDAMRDVRDDLREDFNRKN